jgi:methylenetetrahydrofolate--tRNA-(uracil-5-)-methyltransferase
MGKVNHRAMNSVRVIGAGLAGCEAAWQIAKRGGRVVLHEMKPHTYSPAHKSPSFAEIVCSNSFKSESLENGPGVLKGEMELLGSLILTAAKEARVPAGGSLAVDREVFSKKITSVLEAMENVEIVRGEVIRLPQDGLTIVATGPLTSEALGREIQRVTGTPLFFYDAISPIVTAESICSEKVFRASRYGKGGEDYINCPMEKETYYQFVDALVQAEKAPLHDFERRYLFEGCLPVEELASRGKDTLAYGPLKPVGLIDPHSGRQPFAVVQLRQENRFGTLFNLVGFQTRLRQDEQRKIFRMIPGLDQADFVRYGSVHRNTFIDSPRLLDESLRLRSAPGFLFAGQITGVEGYMESTSMGLLAGINALRVVEGKDPIVPPPVTAIGALLQYITRSTVVPFQPMNVNFGLFPPPPARVKGRRKKQFLSSRALDEMAQWRKTCAL